VRAIVIQEPNSFSSESSCVRSLATDNPHPKWADYTTLIVVVTSMILPLLSLLWVNVRSKREILWGKGKLRWMAPAYAAAIALVFLWICEQWFQANGGVLGAKQPHELLFRLRAIEVFSTTRAGFVHTECCLFGCLCFQLPPLCRSEQGGLPPKPFETGKPSHDFVAPMAS